MFVLTETELEKYSPRGPLYGISSDGERESHATRLDKLTGCTAIKFDHRSTVAFLAYRAGRVAPTPTASAAAFTATRTRRTASLAPW